MQEEEVLTEQEAAVYDRQIRVWGVDAQRRLSKTRVLVVGMNGVMAETCKNIVLAGVGSVTIMDDRPVSVEVGSGLFLVSSDKYESNKGSIATLCAESLKDFNPMVQVLVEEGSLLDKSADFLDNFDAVVLSRSSANLRIQINSLCRSRPHKVAFYAVDCRGCLGEIFVDLQNYSYCSKKSEGEEPKVLQFCGLKDALSVGWKSLPRRTTKLFFAMRIIEEFEQANGRTPGQISPEDLESVLVLRKELCEAQGLPESWVPEKLLQRILAFGGKELPPVCAILGGILGQEIIKAMSCKGEPLKNFFFFDANDGKGIIEDIC